MVIPDEDIIRFQELYQKYFGKEISREDAYEQGIKLLRLMSLVYQPMTEEEFSRIQERRKSPLPIPTD
ncbi:MAG: hypothetical protein A2925_04870 [Candidatus Yanofskybacteria bacterium RIFCSPLOWO2_01_FULL_44_22]|uniref:Uncharacterized protein n=1 Tax=Candidatus Yanofskybacteria bacterium RIFCSPLOWO2_01_FULL_44_22 TaxID=1802697 RepID=A0A1F8GKV9_9BACT|nr:MAG: hypothetical protein A2925_04870 [Candidatus Yanofskybacteria bacterium RIFCSPLOWO2_01_FULL_44_22]